MFPLDQRSSRCSMSDIDSPEGGSSRSVHVRNCKGSDDMRTSKTSGELSLEAQLHAACKVAEQQYLEDFIQSGIRDNVLDFPRFESREVRQGSMLGRGTFGQVTECQGIIIPEFGNRILTKRQLERIRQQEESQRETALSTSLHMALMEIDDADGRPNESNDQWLETSVRLQEDAQRLEHAEQRKFLATHCWRDGGEARYAVKSLKGSVIATPETLFHGILDLNAETRFLSSLPYHPNIVRLRGMSGGNRFDPHFFLILDRLNDTLETRLEKWRRRLEDKSLSPPQPWYKCGCLPSSQNDKNERLQILDTTEWQVQTAHRLCFSFDLSSAMAHLHKYRMMHRDLKPNNIGFDIRGDVKIFDLGFAKEIPQDTPGPWRLTAMVGSPRYMAPEVALGQPYDGRCDVYSLALLIWEILNVDTPFHHFTVEDLQRSVWDDATSLRPEVLLVAPSSTPTCHDENQVSSFLASPKSGWTNTLKALVEKSWAHNLSERPTMEQLESELNMEVARCLKVVHKLNCGGARDFLSSKRLSHDTRRSTFIYKSGAAVVDSKLKRFGFSCVE